MAFTPLQVSAAQAYIAAHPEEQQRLAQDMGGDINSWLTDFTGWWSDFGGNVKDLSPYGDQLKLITDLGGKITLAPGQTGLPQGIQAVTGQQDVPLEQGILNKALPGLVGDIDADA